MSRKTQNTGVIIFVMLTAIQLILCFIPGAGTIRAGGLVIVTTHLPVLLCGVVLGPAWGGLQGVISGLCVMLAAGLKPDPILSPLFTPFYSRGVITPTLLSLIVSFVPVILAGIGAGINYRGLSGIFRGRWASLGISGAVGGFVFRALGCLAVFLIFRTPLSQAMGIAPTDILRHIISPSAGIEVLGSGIITLILGISLLNAYQGSES